MIKYMDIHRGEGDEQSCKEKIKLFSVPKMAFPKKIAAEMPR